MSYFIEINTIVDTTIIITISIRRRIFLFLCLLTEAGASQSGVNYKLQAPLYYNQQGNYTTIVFTLKAKLKIPDFNAELFIIC